MEIQKKISGLVIVIIILLAGCMSSEPEPIVINKDVCVHCKMPISDLKFSSELITDKGRVYKFDDIVCLINYTNELSENNYTLYFSNYANPKQLIHQDKVQLIKNNSLNGPMNGQIIAFETMEQANATLSENEAVSLKDLMQ